MIRPSFNDTEGQMGACRADVLSLGVADLQTAETAMEEAFFRETIGKVDPRVVIPIHWDIFFSPLTRPAVGMPRLIEKNEVVFYRPARYCAAKGRNCLVQIPGTSVELQLPGRSGATTVHVRAPWPDNQNIRARAQRRAAERSKLQQCMIF